VEALLPQPLAGRFRAQELHEVLRRLALLRLQERRRAVDDRLLKLRRQRPEDVDPRHRQELAELLRTDVGGASRHDRADELARSRGDDLRRHRLGNAELLQRLHEMDAARALAVRHRARGEEGALQFLGRADVRFRTARAHAEPRGRPRERRAARPGELAFGDERIGELPGTDEEISRLAAADLFGEARPAGVRDVELAAALVLGLGPELDQRFLAGDGTEYDEAHERFASKSSTGRMLARISMSSSMSAVRFAIMIEFAFRISTRITETRLHQPLASQLSTTR